MIVAEEVIGHARASRDFWETKSVSAHGHKSFRVEPIFWCGDYGLTYFQVLPTLKGQGSD